MPEDSKLKDPGAIWQDQPAEKLPVSLEQLMNRRARELHSGTRAETVMSIVAAVFFAAIVAWRLAWARNGFQEVGLAAVVVWVLISMYWFRDRIRRAGPPPGDALAATGLEYYRKELERRRDHLRNEWLWHGPLVLACLILVGVVAGRAFQGLERLENAAPLILLLILWTGFSIRRRLRQASEVQQELDRIAR
jgi:hypothetical protein